MIKFYDCFGTEVHQGDTVVTARPSRKLRIITLEVLEVVPVETWYNAMWESPEFTTDITTGVTGSVFGGPLSYKRTTVKYKYTEVKTYKNLRYATKHGVKFNRIMKLENKGVSILHANPSAMP